MKKVLVSLALVAAVLNGTLASAGSSSLSASELQVDGVEALADGGEDNPEKATHWEYWIYETSDLCGVRKKWCEKGLGAYGANHYCHLGARHEVSYDAARRWDVVKEFYMWDGY